jgi:hypothetical protein
MATDNKHQYFNVMINAWEKNMNNVSVFPVLKLFSQLVKTEKNETLICTVGKYGHMTVMY